MSPSRSLLAALALVTGCAALAGEPPAAPSATPVKHPTLKSCNREATAKKLSGKDREQYVQACMGHQAPRTPG